MQLCDNCTERTSERSVHKSCLNVHHYNSIKIASISCATNISEPALRTLSIYTGQRGDVCVVDLEIIIQFYPLQLSVEWVEYLNS